MTQKEKYEMILEKLNIKEYFDKGFKGQDVKIASVESLKSEHGRNVYLTLKTYAPLCDVYSFNDEMGISATGDQNTPDTINFPKFVDWCIEKGIHIVTSSLNWEADEEVEQEAIKKLYDNGIIFFNSAGNDGDEDNFGDGDDASNIDVGVISVSSVGMDIKGNYYWSDFDFGEAIDCLGIGSNLLIKEVINDKEYWYTVSGTSFATPLIAAMFAVLKSSGFNVDSKSAMICIDGFSDDFKVQTMRFGSIKTYYYKLFKLPSIEEMEETEDTSDWKQEFNEAVEEMKKLKMTDGLRLKENITREEAIVMLYRLYNKIKEEIKCL